MIATIAAHQIRALRRQRVWTALVVSMLAVSAMAGVLGWSSAHTIVRVYDQAVTLLAPSGQPARRTLSYSSRPCRCWATWSSTSH